MRICLRTPVKGNYVDVLRAFDRDLFEALAPPLVNVQLLRFDGSSKGDLVHLKLRILGIFKQEWLVKITDEQVQNKMAWFTDEGRKLPSVLKSWEHNHIVEKDGENSIIVDDIHFIPSSPIMGALLYPGLYLQFLWRKPIYKRYFAKKFAQKAA
ncbi:MAG: hypothetical protein AAGD28_25570 [Bacteroidota bacterium]